jgi:hypothetical protein
LIKNVKILFESTLFLTFWQLFIWYSGDLRICFRNPHGFDRVYNLRTLMMTFTITISLVVASLVAGTAVAGAMKQQKIQAARVLARSRQRR